MYTSNLRIEYFTPMYSAEFLHTFIIIHPKFISNTPVTLEIRSTSAFLLCSWCLEVR